MDENIENQTEEVQEENQEQVQDETKATDADLAGAALESTKDVEEPSQPDPNKPIFDQVTALREDRRALREDNRFLREQLQSQQQAPASEEKSPYQKLIEEEGPDAIPSVAVQMAQREFEREQDADATQQTTAKTQQQVMDDSYDAAIAELGSAELAAAGLDLETVIRAGTQNLSARDQQIIARAGANAAQKAYELCLARTPELNTKKMAFDKSRQAAPEAKAEAEAKAKAEAEAAGGNDNDNPENREPSENQEVLQHLFNKS